MAHSFETLERIAAQGIVPENFNRGVRVLTDKDGLSGRILPKSFSVPKSRPVAREQFSTDVQMFWFLAVYIAKQILRGDLWVAKARDADLKALLLRMIEWRERAARGADTDTWHAGRFLREWASPGVYELLFRDVRGALTGQIAGDALVKTCALYRALSRDVAPPMPGLIRTRGFPPSPCPGSKDTARTCEGRYMHPRRRCGLKLRDSFHPYAMTTILFWSLAYVLTRLTLRDYAAPSLGLSALPLRFPDDADTDVGNPHEAAPAQGREMVPPGGRDRILHLHDRL